MSVGFSMNVCPPENPATSLRLSRCRPKWSSGIDLQSRDKLCLATNGMIPWTLASVGFAAGHPAGECEDTIRGEYQQRQCACAALTDWR